VVVGVVWGSTWAGGGESAAVADVTGSSNTIGAFGLALVGVFFSYGGWQHASYLSGEAKDPKRTIPLAMIFGASIVTITYVLINVAFLRLMSPVEMAASQRVAADAVSTVLPYGAKFVATIIAISTFGTTLIYTLSAPRIYFAMAEDGLFFKTFATVHPRYRTPIFSVVFQSIWAIVLLLMWKTFNNVITYVTFTDWIFFTLAACIVIIFRRKRKDAERPYRTFGYPITPLIFIIVSGMFIINMVIKEPQQTIVALILLSLGYPVFRFFRSVRSKTSVAPPS
jgi:APA family basic amino acid/polyamine antiporter